jgi:class 3 adenylate cyclase
MALYFDPSDPQLKQKVQDLRPTPGYCVFVDMADSTAMKDQELHRWASKIHNAFAKVSTFMVDGSYPLKSIGDALLYFIPKTQLVGAKQVALQLFASLAAVVDDQDPVFPEQKAAVVSGEAYELTFIRDRPDIYGKDVDLVARLASIAESRELVMNRGFYEEVKAEFDQVGSGAGFHEIGCIRRRSSIQLKGFAHPVELFSYRR